MRCRHQRREPWRRRAPEFGQQPLKCYPRLFLSQRISLRNADSPLKQPSERQLVTIAVLFSKFPIANLEELRG